MRASDDFNIGVPYDLSQRMDRLITSDDGGDDAEWEAIWSALEAHCGHSEAARRWTAMCAAFDAYHADEDEV